MRSLVYKLSALTLAFAGIAAAVSYGVLRASLPTLDGELAVDTSLTAPVALQRDSKGILTVTADSREGAAFGLGFAHAQDRFFQMDLARRMAAGELSELFGKAALSTDKRYRLHQMRSVAQQTVASMTPAHRALINQYVAGVNAGLTELSAKPFEYWLINKSPRVWLAEDSILVSMAMVIQMTSELANKDFRRSLLLELGGEELLHFVQPKGTKWDSAIDGTRFNSLPTPVAEVFSLHAAQQSTASLMQGEQPINGSNSWAVSGALTEHGGALLSNDPHLGMNVPNIWYRVQLNYPAPDGNAVSMNGVSVAGLPAMAIGTNGKVAWSMTNSAGDWADFIALTIDGDQYQTAQGLQPLQQFKEMIKVAGSDPVEIDIQRTQWGPVATMANGKPAAYRWLLQYPNTLNAMPFLDLDTAATAGQAAAIANVSGVSPFNYIVADAQGDIQWTLLGILPKRGAQPTERVVPWQQADDTWQGWLAAKDYPQVSNATTPYIWTANNRIVGGDMVAKIGRGTYELGARALLVEQDLKATRVFNEARMATMLQNNRAIVVDPWAAHIEAILSNLQLAGERLSAHQLEALTFLKNRSGKADANDVGYTLGREYRAEFSRRINRALNQSVRDKGLMPADAKDQWLLNRESEGALVQLRDQQPLHWLPAGHADWHSFSLSAFDAVIAKLTKRFGSLDQANWGKFNALKMEHPLASALPSFLATHINMPVSEQSGDAHMPLAQGPRHGQSMRFVVAPGNEASGFLTLPGGQSGHPLSDFFSAGHSDYVQTKNTPLLPGDAQHSLRLVPKQ